MGLLTRDQIAVVKDDLEEKGWSSYRNRKEHPTFNCSKNAIINLVNEVKGTGSRERKKAEEQKQRELHQKMKSDLKNYSALKTNIQVLPIQ